MRYILLIVLFTLSFARSSPAAGQPKVLSLETIKTLKKKPCTFFHVWATWCTVCLQELPDLIKVLATIPKLNPVVIDISSPFVQNQFSKKWAVTLASPFPVYVKPDAKDETYMRAIEPKWSGALPFSELYDKGELKKKWMGALDLATLRNEVAALCR